MKDPPLQSTMDLKFLFFFVIVINCLPSDYEYTDDDDYFETKTANKKQSFEMDW